MSSTHDLAFTSNHAASATAQLAESRLRGAAYRGLRQVRCEFRAGKLILHGRVSSFFLKQVAQSLVGSLPGVTRLDNRLEVAAAPDGASP